MTDGASATVKVEQRHRDAAARALDYAPNSLTWENLTAAHVSPDQRWQANRVAETFARFEAEHLSRDAWQPIETAPKDGTWFWGYWPVSTKEDRQQPTSWWSSSNERVGPCFHDLSDTIDWCQPTHWRPLPMSPASDAENGK